MGFETSIVGHQDRLCTSRQRGHELAALATSQYGVIARRRRAAKPPIGSGAEEPPSDVGELRRRRGVFGSEVSVRLVCRPGIDWEVDFLWRRERLVLGTDGGRFHASRAQIERDRRKEADLVIAGYRALRATYLQVEREADVVGAMVRAAMTARQL